jgi:hypothetical protein
MSGFGKIYFIALLLVFSTGTHSLASVGEVNEKRDESLESVFPTIVLLAQRVQNAAIAFQPQTPRLMFNAVRIVTPKKDPVLVDVAKEGGEAPLAVNGAAIPMPLETLITNKGTTPDSLTPSTGEVLISNDEVRAPAEKNAEVDASALPGNTGALLSTIGTVGGLPIPVAQVTPGSYIQNARPLGSEAEQLSELMGEAKSSFGKNRADGSFASLTDSAKKKALSEAEAEEQGNIKLTPEEKKQKEEEEKQKEEEKLAAMKESMEKFQKGVTPFDTDEYPAYQEARDQFFRDDPRGKLLSNLLKDSEQKDQVVEKMKNLFYKNARLDEDTLQSNGKDNFQRFIEAATPSQKFRGAPSDRLHEPARH